MVLRQFFSKYVPCAKVEKKYEHNVRREMNTEIILVSRFLGKSNINTAFLGLLEQLLENVVVLPATNILSRFGRRGADLHEELLRWGWSGARTDEQD